MKTTPQHPPLSSLLDARLVAYAAVAAAGTAIVPTPVQAAVVSSGPLNLAVPQNIDGIYLNFVTGASGTTGSGTTGWDFNPYASSSGTLLAFNSPSVTGRGGLTLSGAYAILAPGAFISSASTFLSGVQTSATVMANYRAGSNGGYLGFAFLNETTGITNYGYVHFSSTGTNGFPATILDYSYENTGAGISVVPEPTSMALLGVVAAGALGLRQWRKRKTA